METVAPKIGSSTSFSTSNSKDVSPFEQMKAALRNNLKGLKKEEDKDSAEGFSQVNSSTTVNQAVSSQGAGANITSKRVSLLISSLKL